MSKQAIEREEYKNKTVVIISAEYYKHDAEANMEATDRLESTLAMESFTFKKALGMYKGVSEKSFIVVVKNASELSSLEFIAKDYNQESMLVRNNDGVYLFYCNGHQERLGAKIVQVSPHYAKKHDAYTVVNDCYYIVK